MKASYMGFKSLFYFTFLLIEIEEKVFPGQQLITGAKVQKNVK